MDGKVIRIKGARQHNLQDLDIEIPREKLVVITGPSGSGKSSLAFDTIFAEGQRKYVESLSVYARQFLDQLAKPDVDLIEGLSPAIAIEQRASGGGPRSTIATSTEIYDFLRVLYAAVGIPHDPGSGRVVERQSPQQMVDALLSLPEGTRVVVLAPIIEAQRGEFRDVIEKLRREGFIRARVDGTIVEIDGDAPVRLDKSLDHTIEAVVDRLVMKDGLRSRLADSIETALKWGGRRMLALVQEPGCEDWRTLAFSTDFSDPVSGFRLPELTARHFSFNSHLGACPACHGIGTQLVCDPTLVVPDESLTLDEGAIKPWAKATKRMKAYYEALLEGLCRTYGAARDVPYRDLPLAFRVALMNGTSGREIKIPARGTTSVIKPFEGILAQMDRLYADAKSELTRHRIRSYMNRQPCQTCEGRRLRPEILAVTLEADGFGERNIFEFCELPVSAALRFLDGLRMSAHQSRIVADVIREIRARISFLEDVGLGYLCLSRESGTLSGGEAQRIRLATQLGAGLAGVLYVLDEPSIGLHQRDNEKLLATLRRLQALGNSVIVVEHDEETIRQADHVIDLGPGAGPQGGRVVAQGTLQDILAAPDSPTGRFLSGRDKIPVPKRRVPPKQPAPQQFEGISRTLDCGWLVVAGASENNLKSVNAAFPVGCMTCVTGVSGSGKSTLVDDVLRRVLARRLHGAKDRPGAHLELGGVEQVDKIIEIDQTPIGKTPRSNPATYSGAFGPIRELFAQLPAARVRGYDSGRFSFNVKGGRCETCKGDGQIQIEMHFLPDVYVRCEQCGGTRYNRETLEITYKGRNIADVLAMTVDEAADFFRNVHAIADKLHALQDVGLGYVRLGQPANTLSGGEAQRIKLAAELARKSTGRTVYVFDEPTTGLHFTDVHRLLDVFFRLRDAGNTLIVVEHNLDVVKCADWILDLGPEGGDGGGEIVAAGPPETVAESPRSHTAPYLRKLLSCLVGALILLAGSCGSVWAAFAVDDATGKPLPLVRAGEAVADGMPAMAVPLLRNLLQDRLDPPVRAEAAELLARALVETADGREALSVLDTIATPSPEAYFLRGEANILLGRWEEAVSAYRQAEKAGFDDVPHLSVRLAIALLRAGKADDALALARTAQRPNSTASPMARLVTAESLLALGKPNEALLEASTASFDPDSPTGKRANYLAARCYLALGDPSKAAELLDPLYTTAEGTPADVYAGAGLAAAEARLALDQPDQAGQIVTQFIDNFPNSPWLRDYFEMLAQVVRVRENYSTRHFRLWVQDEKHAERSHFSRYFLARALVLAGDNAQALDFLKPLLSADTPEPLHTDAVVEFARITAEEASPDKALDLLTRMAEGNKDANVKARMDFAAAEILRAQGDYLDAAARFEEAATSPTLAENALYNRAVCLIAARDEARFLEAYRDFSACFPESPLRSGLVLEQGLMQARMGADNASRTIEVFLRDFPGHARAPEAQATLARLALSKSPPDLDTARTLLTTLESATVSDAMRGDVAFLSLQLAKADPQTPLEALAAKARQFIETNPESPYTETARMILAEAYFRVGDYGRAQVEFELLADQATAPSMVETAYYLAADSAVRTLNPQTLDHAVELYESAASVGGPLKHAARIGQARIKFRQGAYSEAMVIYDDVLGSEPDARTRLDAMLGKAEAMISAGAADASLLPQAIRLLREIAVAPDATPALRNQALWKAGRTLELMGRDEDALTTYYEAFAESPANGQTLDFFWHDKAAFDAGRLLESRQQWQSAVGIYRKLATLPGPRAEEASQRLNRIRLEHFLWED